MKQIVYYGTHDMRIEEAPIPEIGPKDVLLKSRLVSICGSDLHPYKSGQKWASIPHEIQGHEYCATVAKVGSEVTKYAVGDRVIDFNAGVCGECWYCRHGDYGHCIHGTRQYTGRGLPGALAQYFKFSYAENPDGMLGVLNTLYKVPENITDEQLCVSEAFGVGLWAVNTAGVKEGDTVVILGTGIIGNSTMQFAKAKGAKTIIVGRGKRRLECAKECGADYVIDNSNGDCYEQIREIAEETGWQFGSDTLAVDVTIDCAGYPGSFNDALKITKCGGTVCEVAFHEQESMVNPQYLLSKDLKLCTVNFNDLPGALQAMADGTVKVEPLIDDIVPLSRFEEAYSRQADGSAVKVLINMEEE